MQNTQNNHCFATPQQKSKKRNQTFPWTFLEKTSGTAISLETLASGCRRSHCFIHPRDLLKVWAIEWGHGRPKDGNMTC